MTKKANQRRSLLYLASEGQGMLSWWVLVMWKKNWKETADVWRTERRGYKSNERENGEERQKWNLFKKSNTCLWLTLADMHAYANLGTNKQDKQTNKQKKEGLRYAHVRTQKKTIPRYWQSKRLKDQVNLLSKDTHFSFAHFVTFLLWYGQI